MRSPASFFEDSIFSPPLLPRMLTKPLMVCGCQSLAFTISASVAPLARFIIAMTSAFLLARSTFGLPAAFLTRPAFFAGLAFLAAVRLGFGLRASAGAALCSDSIVVFIPFLLDPTAVVTFIALTWRNSKSIL